MRRLSAGFKGGGWSGSHSQWSLPAFVFDVYISTVIRKDLNDTVVSHGRGAVYCGISGPIDGIDSHRPSERRAYSLNHHAFVLQLRAIGDRATPTILIAACSNSGGSH